MAHSYAYEDDEYFGDEPPFFDETLAGALDNTVQLSINKALEKALGPLTLHFESFACQKGWLPPIASSEEALSDQPSTSKGKAKTKSWAHSDIFRKLASSIQKEHGYSSSQAQDTYGSDSDQSSSKSSSRSDSEEDLGTRPGASKRKKSESTKAPPTKAPKVLTFSPEEIVHPRSSSWVPPPEVAEYLQKHIRAGFDKDVRARLRAECPSPELEVKVTDTPDVDPTMVTFLKKWAKDPKKGLDRACRSCQDKLLDLSGPLAKILEMAYVAKESQHRGRTAPLDSAGLGVSPSSLSAALAWDSRGGGGWRAAAPGAEPWSGWMKPLTSNNEMDVSSESNLDFPLVLRHGKDNAVDKEAVG
ncbi:hypothetical protein NDU88_011451 [Pleurodeles waltl]|uniref:Uncharacterized protein n=1 Tax=Pleurodeles waltl TaxID=8319 RepID=A0AAV7PYW1_PLEWA|nr:hypothetical protein NDU88_011451 [Pleurodeles waltl]